MKSPYQKSGKNHPNYKGYEKISGAFFSSIKGKAKKRGIKFDVTIKYLWDLFKKQKGRCALSGLKIHFAKNSKTDRRHSASLDRVDSNKGYVKNNLQWLDKRVNLIKWHFSQKEFLFLCNRISKHNRK